MYIRKKYGVEIVWNKEDDTAKQAVENVTNSTEYPVEVTKEQAERIKQEYKALKEARE